MIKNNKILVVIPVFKIQNNVFDLLGKIPEQIDKVIIIDDKCPFQTGKKIENQIAINSKIKIIFNNKNLGVGGAVKKGYIYGLEKNFDVIVKIDGDGQMDPQEIIELINPLIDDGYDYSKGNRFLANNKISNYPKTRFYGNIMLSFLTKLSSGYWDIFDPINGFTAIKSDIIRNINLANVDNRYFFETDMLFNLNIKNYTVKDVPVNVKYFQNHTQNLNIFKETFNFSIKNFVRFFLRINKKYLNHNFSITSLFGSLFILSSIFTILYGGGNYFYYSIIQKVLAPTGIVISSFFGFFLMIVSFLLFCVFDSYQNPNLKKND